MRQSNSRKVALCGVLGALSVAMLLLGNLLQIGTYCAPMLAAFLLIPPLEEYGLRYALMEYAVAAVLGILLVPDKELALFYTLVLGYYPALRCRLERVRFAPLRWGLKFAAFNGTVVAMYLLLLLVFLPGELLGEFAAGGLPFLAAMLAMGNLAFWLFDRALRAMTLVYRTRLRPKLKWR